MRQGGLSQLLNPREESPDVTVLVAAKDIPAMEILDGSCVEKKTVKRSAAGESFYTDSVEVINRVLTVSVKEGEILSQAKLAPKDASWKFASLLEAGSRAVSIALNDSGALFGLVYPGSLVDVIGTFKLSASGNSSGDTISVTVLQAVPVIGVQDETVVTKESDAEAGGDGKGGASKPPSVGPSRNRWIVTLMVSAEQAKDIALVMKAGELSLALRNPSDKTIPIDRGAVSLKELTRSTGGGAAPGPEALAALLDRVRALEGGKQPGMAPAGGAKLPTGAIADAEGARWNMQIIRGSTSSTVSLKLQEGGPQDAVNAGGIRQ
jgi:Flp pilus assembly protein CpaB